MDHFNYKSGKLFAEDVAIEKIAAQIGTPFYCYSKATITRHYKVIADVFKSVDSTICYAVKANSNIAVLRILADLGSGADTVSEGEIRRAVKAGIPAKKIVFSGVGKTREEISYALKLGIMQFNVESEAELIAINEVAKKLGKKAPVAFRVNPDVDAGTHDKIATGRKSDKFGIEWKKVRAIYKKASRLPNVKIIGISAHIGSQLTSLKPFRQAAQRIAKLAQELKAEGYNIKHIDLGGGLGVPYIDENPPSPKDYAKLLVDSVKHLGCRLLLEPGRVIAGNAGILVSKVIYTKTIGRKSFVIVDAAMNDLMRPSLYEAKHQVVPVKQSSNGADMVDIVGPICETGDVLARDRKLPKLSEGDLIAFRTAGAYGATMSNTYNSRLLVPEVLVDGKRFAVVRKRTTYEQMLGNEIIPDWL